MKSFLLHEDTGEPEDNKRTDALHAFLHPLCADTQHDFEGSNSGLMVYLHVRPGDTMVLRADNSIRVYEKDTPVSITRVSFPRVYEAMLAVEHDNGAHHVNRIHGDGTVNLDTFVMPYEYGVDKLCRAESALEALCTLRSTDNPIDDFACGEQGEIEELIKVLSPKILDLQIAHDLINDWFNAWEKS